MNIYFYIELKILMIVIAVHILMQPVQNLNAITISVQLMYVAAAILAVNFLYTKKLKRSLQKDEYEEILTFNIFIKALGYGITKGDSRYRAGIKLIDSIKHIYDKLKSDEAFAFFEDIQKSEMEYLKEEYNLSNRNIEEIFNEYAEDFRDRSIVSYIYDNSEEAGREEAWQLGYVKDDDSISSKYFDYKKFGEDLVEDDEYFMELCDGRVVRLSY